MFAIISPAKTLDFDTPYQGKIAPSAPQLTDESAQLIAELQRYSPAEIASLMKLSDKLASLNVARYAEWQPEHTLENSKPALFAFKGDVYTGLDADSLSEEALAFGQAHLGILSGLYGLLNPFDLIEPYRLEMGTKLATSRGKNLYEFWGGRVTELLNQRLAQEANPVLINLASEEYYSVLQPKNIRARIIKPIFLDEKQGKFKVISFYAKKARGMMVRYLLSQPCYEADQLKAFTLGGYWFDEESSSENEWVFKRNAQDAEA